jgi:hypothetical protein
LPDLFKLPDRPAARPDGQEEKEMYTKGMTLIASALLLTGAKSPGQELSGLAWMSGTWVAQQGSTWTEEHWLAPRAGMMLGTSFSERNGKIREFEFMRIAAEADGSLVYWASPGGRPAVPFRLASVSPNRVIFENPTHDFPTRITYQRTGLRMVATIAGPNGANAQSWTYRRSR